MRAKVAYECACCGYGCSCVRTCMYACMCVCKWHIHGHRMVARSQIAMLVHHNVCMNAHCMTVVSKCMHTISYDIFLL